MAEEAALKRCEQLKSAHESADRISLLSDTTLAHILSFLNLKEAARCDLLSPRWKGLWKQLTRLDFDASEELFQVHTALTAEDILRINPSRSNYITWVNQVLTLHASPTLDQFRVQFDLDTRASEDIDWWIKFAISKRVKKLDIDLTSYSSNKQYVICPEFCDYLKSPVILPDLQHLTSLSLAYVNIDGALVEYFLTSCPHLENLDVSFSTSLINLKVVGPSLPLKHLAVCACHSLESIELSAPNLASFSYIGKPAIFHIGNNPLLTRLSLGSLGYPTVAPALDAFSNLLSQVQTLKLSVGMLQLERKLSPVVEFTHLRQLTLEVMASSESLMGLADLVFASPSLEKCTLQLVTVSPRLWKREWMAEKPSTQPHQRLKDIYITGFRGCSQVTELIDFLVLNTTSLEKVVIDPYRTRDMRPRPLPGEDCGEEIMTSREAASQLKETLPHGVELTVM